ncbi:glucosaminidase domain-containing protein [Viscerimonas tarda]
MKQNSAMVKKHSLILIIVLHAVSLGAVYAQVRINKAYEEYVRNHKDMAIKHMDKYKIPASITLGQGLLESGAGKGDLVVRANNHFGIKCGGDWKGPSVRAKDDGPNDCFRKYGKTEDSFEDHSLFLSGKTRYIALFTLEITDYKGWARGLQKAGYATDKAYANKLIKLIEDYELYRYDTKNKRARNEKEVAKPVDYKLNKHTPYKTFGLVYVIAQANDSYEAIAAEFDFKPKDLYKYNEVPEGFPVQPGDLIYFQKKKKKADKPYYEHIVKIGESMHSISQLYGIRVGNLYKMNKRDYEYVPTEWDVLRLR